MPAEQVSFRGSAVPIGNDGHWGAITSSVDWCELNYIFSHYVAEFWNSSSSLSMVVVGLLGIFLHRKVLETRFLLAFFFVSVLGVGSVLFHGSLKHETQMLDELPMLYAAFTTTFILLENKREPVFGSWLAPFLIIWSLVTSFATLYATGIWQFLMFHASFGSAEFFSLYRIYKIYSKWMNHPGADSNNPGVGPRTEKNTKQIQRDIKKLFKIGMSSYGIGLFVWQFDLRYCQLLQVWWPAWSGLPNPQFHAWWHVCVSSGFYLLITLSAYDRLVVLRNPSLDHSMIVETPTLEWWCGVVPFVALKNRRA